MTRLLAGLVLCATLAAGGCRLLTWPGDDEACPRASGYLNRGCARLVVVVEGGPPEPWPRYHRFEARATPVRPDAGADAAFEVLPRPGTVRIQLTRRGPIPPGSGDTASVWVSARLMEYPEPYHPDNPLTVFAADSVLHVVRFAPVGSRPRVDTVRLTLRTGNRE